MILLNRITLFFFFVAFLWGQIQKHSDLSLRVYVCNTGPEPSTFMQYGKVREKTSGVSETG